MATVTGKRRRYVGVYLYVATDGTQTPAAIRWSPTRLYPIDDVLDMRHTHGSKSGEDGVRYVIKIGNVTTYLWRTGKWWYVEEKIIDSDNTVA